jgi:hypothetical protein
MSQYSNNNLHFKDALFICLNPPDDHLSRSKQAVVLLVRWTLRGWREKNLLRIGANTLDPGTLVSAIVLNRTFFSNFHTRNLVNLFKVSFMFTCCFKMIYLQKTSNLILFHIYSCVRTCILPYESDRINRLYEARYHRERLDT